MADNQTTAVLNLGSQRISMAVFEATKTGKLILQSFESDELPGDPLLDAARESQVESILSDLVSKLSISKSKVRYAISGQTIFIRFVKLPSIGGDNLEQLVTFEAQQHVPFPIDEVIWDYELIEGGDEKEVVIVAIKGDALEEVNSTVQSTGLTTAEVDAAPMALYNSFIASYGKPAESTLLIDVGARTSNLLFIEGDKFFTRSVAIGGASVTAAIVKEFGISFAQAEQQKRKYGLVALGGGHTHDLDESTAALAMCIRTSMTRLPAEISRTTNYYRSQHGGSAPKQIFLAGGGANLPYTLEFFKEKLNLPIEFFNPLHNIAMGKEVDTEKVSSEAHMMGELVGLALRSVGQSRINVDLVTEAIGANRAAEKRKPFLILASVLLIASFGVWAVLNHMAANRAEDELRTMAEIRDELSPLGAEIKSLLRTEEQLNAVAQRYIELEKDHSYWYDVLAEINGTFADDSMWITEMIPMFGFKPFETEGGTSNAVTQPAIRSDFAQTQKDGSAVKVSVKKKSVPNKFRPRGRRIKEEEPEEMKIDSIVLKGFWRENPRSQNVVSDALAKLRMSGGMFNFTLTKPDGSTQELTDEQLLQVSVTGSDGDLGYPFQVVLQLDQSTSAK